MSVIRCAFEYGYRDHPGRALPATTARNLGHLMLQVGHGSLAASIGPDAGANDIVSDIDAMLMALIRKHLSLRPANARH